MSKNDKNKSLPENMENKVSFFSIISEIYSSFVKNTDVLISRENNQISFKITITPK